MIKAGSKVKYRGKYRFVKAIINRGAYATALLQDLIFENGHRRIVNVEVPLEQLEELGV
ncbi:MAG: hypothetical protein ABF991_03575 [Liquorilactobacillus hordei]|uniref:hypothetical protein n=1 Tax=Liquorilactobacillus hordei TaxID=468911 RepID=UPI0039EC356B